MGSITLNKPSGGQLTIAPEDGTSNETVTIPSVGVGKVLQTGYFKQQTGLMRDMSSVGTTIAELNSNWVDIGGTSSITFNKISSDSKLIVESVVHVYSDQVGDANRWAVVHQRILVNSSEIATTADSPDSASAYGFGWNSTSATSMGRMMGHIPLAGSVEGIPAGSVDIRIQATAGSSNTTLIAFWNSYGTGYIRVMEVAA